MLATAGDLGALLFAVALSAVGQLQAAEPDPASPPTAEPAAESRFTDPEDGRFDVSGFLDTAYGFVPPLVPITEPAVGYGAVGALVFIHSTRRSATSTFGRR